MNTVIRKPLAVHPDSSRWDLACCLRFEWHTHVATGFGLAEAYNSAYVAIWEKAGIVYKRSFAMGRNSSRWRGVRKPFEWWREAGTF